MLHTLTVWLVAVATVVSGLLAGISFDKSLVQLPARYRLGVITYAAYSRAADLGRGLLWYPLLGIGAPALLLLAAILVLVQRLPAPQTLAISVAAVLGVAHLLTTSRAAPILLKLHRSTAGERAGRDEATIHALLQRFARWQAVRCLLQIATFVVALWALLMLVR